ncbi:MAG: alpha/beta fold hydrolase [Betaproteobacteria bacterium]
MKVRANGIDIEVQDSGTGAADTRPVVLLIMGLGLQLVAWPAAVLRLLDEAGYRVIRFDNRDIGLSQHFDHLGKPNLLWTGLRHRLRWNIRAPYTLDDMAADSIGVLDALRVGKAHVVGVSMGGMIAQRLTLAAPQRVASLTSIMSSSGARGLPQADPRLMRVLFGRPANSSRDAIVAHYVRLYQAIGSPGHLTDEVELVQRIGMAVDRNYHPAGTLRQMVAIAADTTRADALSRIAKPTLVLHGLADPLLPAAHGRDTAQRIPGAQFAAIEGMGHDLAQGVVDRLMPHIAPFLLAHR